MVAMKFYRKLRPDTPVPVDPAPNVIKFATLDSILGWFATDNPAIQAKLTDHIEHQRCGISEVTWEEFDSEYVKKKASTGPLKKVWREELSHSNFQRSAPAFQTNPVPVAVVTDMSGQRMEDDPLPSKNTPGTAIANDTPPSPDQQFRPTVGKRVTIQP